MRFPFGSGRRKKNSQQKPQLQQPEQQQQQHLPPLPPQKKSSLKKSTAADPLPSLVESSSSDASSKNESGDVPTAVVFSPSRSSSSSTALIPSSLSTQSSSPRRGFGTLRAPKPLTPTRKKGYAVVAENKVAEEEEKNEDMLVSTNTGTKGRFGFVRMVSRIRTRSFGPKDEPQYSPPSAALLPPEPPSSPTAELWNKFFGSIPPESDDFRWSNHDLVERPVKVTVEEVVNIVDDKPSPPPPVKERKQKFGPWQFSSSQQQQKNQVLLQPPPQAPLQLVRDQRKVRYRDEVSLISATDFTASFVYDHHGDDDEDEDEFSHSAGTGTSSASYASGVTGESQFTDHSGFTSTLSDPTNVTECMLDAIDNDTPRHANGRRAGFVPPRSPTYSSCFPCGGRGGGRSGGSGNISPLPSFYDDDDIYITPRPPPPSRQGVVEGCVDDFRVVVTELVRDLLCLSDPAKV